MTIALAIFALCLLLVLFSLLREARRRRAYRLSRTRPATLEGAGSHLSGKLRPSGNR